MKLKSVLSVFTIFAAFFGLTQTASAKIKLTNKDKREIIRQILQQTNFSDALEYVPDGTLFLSTENISVKIRKNFPKIRGVKFQFITPEEIGNSTVKVNYFAFGEFQTRKKFVEVVFVQENLPTTSGRSFLCRRFRGKWKIRVNKFILEIV